MIFSQKDVIYLTAELTTHFCTEDVTKALLGLKCHHLFHWYIFKAEKGSQYDSTELKEYEIVPSFCFCFLTRSSLVALSLLDLDQYLIYFGNCLGVRAEITPKKERKKKKKEEGWGGEKEKRKIKRRKKKKKVLFCCCCCLGFLFVFWFFVCFFLFVCLFFVLFCFVF